MLCFNVNCVRLRCLFFFVLISRLYAVDLLYFNVNFQLNKNKFSKDESVINRHSSSSEILKSVHEETFSFPSKRSRMNAKKRNECVCVVCSELLRKFILTRK